MPVVCKTARERTGPRASIITGHLRNLLLVTYGSVQFSVYFLVCDFLEFSVIKVEDYHLCFTDE